MDLIAIISVIAFAMGWLLVIYFTWGHRCALRTLVDRDAIIDTIYDIPNHDFFPRYEHILTTVQFGTHVRELMLFRDPWLLYPADLAEEAKRRRKEQ